MTEVHCDGSQTCDARIREAIQNYASWVRESTGQGGLSLTLIGRVLSGGFQPNTHNVQSVLVLDRIDFVVMARLAEQGPRYGKTGIAAPLLMTPKHIETSLDSFPLELLEIQQRHSTLWGEDPFGSLTFDATHVRLECERELKRFLIGLRQGVLSAAGRASAMDAVVRDIGEGILRACRGLLWIKGATGFEPDDKVVGKLETIIGRSFPSLCIVAASGSISSMKDVESLYREIEHLKEVVDAR